MAAPRQAPEPTFAEPRSSKVFATPQEEMSVRRQEPERALALPQLPELVSAPQQAPEPTFAEPRSPEVSATPQEEMPVRGQEPARVLARPRRPEQVPARRRELG
jgi:hypothetical protein